MGKTRTETMSADPDRWAGKPFSRLLADGRGQLEIAYFSLDVLESNRDDSRYRYASDDFAITSGTGDEEYVDESPPLGHKVVQPRVGFAYDTSTLTGDEVVRYACVLLADLGALTSEHQMRWRSHRHPEAEAIRPHPVWLRTNVLGQWPDGLGPFQKILAEMGAINEVFELAFGVPLFRKTERPREWGWVLRPSALAWHEFVLVTDKLLSDNLDGPALTRAKAPLMDPQGNPMGTIERLEAVLVNLSGLPSDRIAEQLHPLHAVRRATTATPSLHRRASH